MKAFSFDTRIAPFDLDLVARSHGWYDLKPFEYEPEKRRLAFVMLAQGRTVSVSVVPVPGGIRATAGSALDATPLSAADKSLVRTTVPPRARWRAPVRRGFWRRLWARISRPRRVVRVELPPGDAES